MHHPAMNPLPPVTATRAIAALSWTTLGLSTARRNVGSWRCDEFLESVLQEWDGATVERFRKILREEQRPS